ncbi:MAG: hypothetical protein AAGE76_13095 [Pseudomonadota bacterium]
MRLVLAISCLAWVAGCAPPVLDPAAKAAQCRTLFKRLDQQLKVEPNLVFIRDVVPGLPRTVPGPVAAENALLQFDCITRPGDVPVATTVDVTGLENPGGTTPAPREFLHVGIVTSNRIEGEFRQVANALGYSVVVRAAPRTGRRIFMGPFRTVESKRGAQALAVRLGYPSTYFLVNEP